jgi:CBS domain-containing protein
MALVTGWSEELFKPLSESALPHRAVVEILQTLPAMVSPETPISDASELAQQMGLHYLPVINALGEAEGVVCRCDLRDAPPGDEVSTVMRAPAVTISATADAHRAAEVMMERGLGCLPVLDEFSVVGMVTRSELLRAELVTPEEAPTCELCGSLFHVVVSDNPRVAQCRSCRETQSGRRPAIDEKELGGGD